MLEKFKRECVQEIAMEVLRRVIRLTPVSQSLKIRVNVYDLSGERVKYKKGKNAGKYKTKDITIHTGGTLRRGWIAQTQEEAEGNNSNPNGNEIEEKAKALKIIKHGDAYYAWLINPVEYASYVEYGHRQTPGRFVPVLGKRLKRAWVPGKHMLQISMQEVESKLPAFLDAKMQDYLNQIFEGGNS